MELVKKYDSSPLTLFRIILFNRNYTKAAIKDALTNHTNLSPTDIKQLKIAIKYDPYVPINQDKQLEQSLAYERLIQKLLDKHGIKYKTQAEITDGVTPDFVIAGGVNINGTVIYWIDAKNFFGADTWFNRTGLKEQAGKYNKVFGNGAFIFRHGFSSRLDVGALLLRLA